MKRRQNATMNDLGEVYRPVMKVMFRIGKQLEFLEGANLPACVRYAELKDDVHECIVEFASMAIVLSDLIHGVDSPEVQQWKKNRKSTACAECGAGVAPGEYDSPEESASSESQSTIILHRGFAVRVPLDGHGSNPISPSPGPNGDCPTS